MRWTNGSYEIDDDRSRLDIDRIVAVARPDNRASRAVLEKLGLRYERDLTLAGIPAVCYAQSRAAHLARDAAAGARARA